MFSVDSNYMNMALATQKVLAKYPELLKDRKSLLKKINLMDTYIEGIQENQVMAETNPQGATESKASATDHAIEMAMDLAGRAFVYADDSEDEVLKAQFGFPRKHLTNVQGVLKVSRLEHLIDQLKTAIEKDPEGYDVTKEEINQLKKATEIFKAQLTNPREVTIVRKSHNDNVKLYLVLLKKTMKSMDRLMTKLKETELYKEYKIARKVIDLGTRKTQGRNRKSKLNKAINKPDDKALTKE